MEIIWTDAAERDRDAVWDYLLTKDPAAAVRIDALFGSAVDQLSTFSFSGHAGLVAGTREPSSPMKATASFTKWTRWSKASGYWPWSTHHDRGRSCTTVPNNDRTMQMRQVHQWVDQRA